MMARRAAAIGQMALIAAIVATVCYWPVGIAAAVLLALFGVSVDAFVTFGGVFNRLLGMAVLWFMFFAPSLVYAAFMFPWEQTHGFRSGDER